MSVSDRAERDLTKRFDEFNIDWDIVENQLRAWSPLFRGGKKLRIEISFICKDATQTTSMRTRQSARGATGRQLAELDEEEAAGKTSHWRDVYNLMRCTGPPCQGRYCWRDPNQGRKHFSLEPHVLQKLVEYVEDGRTLRTHDDVPQYIRDLIHAKDEADSERRKKKQKTSSADSVPQIHIHNIIPGHPNAAPNESSEGPNVDIPVNAAATRLKADLCIPGLRDDAIKRYCQWHCTQVNNKVWKTAFIKAGSITLEQGLDLKHVYADQDVDFYVKEGVLRGIARSFVEDVKKWIDEA